MKINIVGAGISGLLAAYYLLKSGHRVEVYEKSPRAGGLIFTSNSPHGNLENAAASLVNSSSVENLFADLGLTQAAPGPRAGFRYIYRGSPKRWPLKLNQSIRLFAGAARLAFSQDKGLEENISVKDWGLRNLGEGATQFLLEPALQGVYAGDIARMNARLVIAPMLAKKTKTPRPKFKGSAMPQGGMQNLIAALVAYIEDGGGRINYSFDIEASDIDLRRPWLISTPAPAAAKLLQGLGVAAGEQLAAVEMLDLSSVHLIFAKNPLPFAGIGCLFPLSEGFNCLGVINNNVAFPDEFSIPSERWFIGGALNKTTQHLSDQVLIDMALADRKKLIASPDQPIAAHIFRNPACLPHFTNHLAKLRKSLALPKNLHLLGNYTGGIGLTSIHNQCKSLPAQFKTGERNHTF